MNEPELEHDGELVPVYATGDLMDAEMVANLLNEEGVQAMVKAKAVHSWLPHIGAFESPEGIKVLVIDSDVQKAKTIIDDFFQNSDLSETEFNQEAEETE